MQIAILGATSLIAKDLAESLARDPALQLTLFARRPQAVEEWLAARSLASRCQARDFTEFNQAQEFDALINLVGSGNPARTAAMGTSILQVTHQYDDLALAYLERHPHCRYIFFSSGAAYGGDFAQPVGDDTPALVPLNHLQASDWYGLAKLYAECRHRAQPELAIVDVRVFNYFSHTQDIATRFLISDILRAILSGSTFQTSSENIVRDYLGPQDMHQLIWRILSAPPCNSAIDCYTREPVDKLSLLDAMHQQFGLRYELVDAPTGFTATGNKANYFSRSRKAGDFFGYTPSGSALDIVLEQSTRLLREKSNSSPEHFE